MRRSGASRLGLKDETGGEKPRARLDRDRVGRSFDDRPAEGVHGREPRAEFEAQSVAKAAHEEPAVARPRRRRLEAVVARQMRGCRRVKSASESFAPPTGRISRMYAMSSRPTYSANRGMFGSVESVGTAGVFGQVMGLVAVTVGFFTLGAYLGRDFTSGPSIICFILGFVSIVGLNFARRSEGLAITMLFAAGVFLGLGLGGGL